MRRHISSSILAVFLFSFLAPFLQISPVSAAPVSVVEFNFNDTVKTASVTNNATFITPGYTADGGISGNINVSKISIGTGNTFSAWSTGAGTGSDTSISFENWQSGSGSKSWMISFSTQNYKTLTVSSKQRGSNTGPRDFKVQYSTGGLWIDVPSSAVTVANNFTTGVLNSVSLPTALENTSTVFLRWIMTSNTSVSAGAIGNTGTSRIDDIVVQGEFIDSIAPVVSLSGSGTTSLEVGSSYTELGATWTDNVDGSGSLLTANTGSVNTGVLGVYTLQYSHTDVSGNIGNTVSRTVHVVDTTLPFVTLSGSSSLTIAQGSVYTDAGASWIDNVDGSGSTLTGLFNATGSFQSSGSVNTAVLGIYTIDYKKVDLAGNVSTGATRTITVGDLEAPFLTIDQLPGQTDPTNTLPISFQLTFSEPINPSTFFTGSLSLTGTASGISVLSISQLAPNNNTTFRIDISALSAGTIEIDVPGFSLVNYPAGTTTQNIAVDTSGNMYAVNTNSNTVTKVSSTGTLVGTYSVGTRPFDVAIDSIGNIYTVNATSGNITKLSPLGTLLATYSVGTSPQSIALDVFGNIYVANSASNNVSKLSSTGVLIGTYPVGTTPRQIILDNMGNIYTANEASKNVSKLSSTGVLLATYALGTAPRSLAVDPFGNIFTVNSGSGNVIKLSSTGVLLGTYPVGVAPSDMVLDSVGNMYVAMQNTHNVIKLSSTGNIIGDQAVGITPRSIVIDSTGYIYTANATSNNITKLTPIGIQDLSGNSHFSATKTDNQVIYDLTLPVVTFSGATSLSIPQNSIYTDSGAIWADDNDGSGSTLTGSYSEIGSFTLSGSVNTAILGTYILKYQKIDAAGNTSTGGMRTVNVIDIIAPILSLVGSGTINLEVGTSYTDSGTIWTDDNDGSGSVVASGSVNTDTLGTYMLTYDYTDISGNIAIQITRTVNIVDTTKPVITLSGASFITIYKNTPYTDAGATWTDNYDGSGTLVGTGNIDVNTIGTYTWTYDFTDASGNAANQVIRTISIIDPIQMGGGGSGGYDRCGPLGDLSGNSRDGICEAPKVETLVIETSITPTEIENTEEIISPEEIIPESSENIYTKNVGEEDIVYTLENNYTSCPIIDTLNQKDYRGVQDIFPDIKNSLNRDIIEKFAGLKIVSGTTQGNFEPKRDISRVEFTKLVLLSHCYSYVEQDTFIDVPASSWQAQVISKAVELGIISGDTNLAGQKVFRPNDIITKAEATKILMRMSLVQTELLGNSKYTDINSQDWFSSYIQTGELLGIFTPQEDNYSFSPNQGVSREEMLAMIYKVIQLYR